MQNCEYDTRAVRQHDGDKSVCPAVFSYLSTKGIRHIHIENEYERNTLLHLGCISMAHEIPLSIRVKYAKRYLKLRYGSNPEDERIPLDFLAYNTITQKDALDIKHWAAAACAYVDIVDTGTHVYNIIQKLKQF